ncbi:MAG: hypothetical protein KBD64_01880 [Gammaproteobacteria bacterium]|nr:hypothetical protein [Gammaproteobacteria bacterium]
MSTVSSFVLKTTCLDLLSHCEELKLRGLSPAGAEYNRLLAEVRNLINPQFADHLDYIFKNYPDFIPKTVTKAIFIAHEEIKQIEDLATNIDSPQPLVAKRKLDALYHKSLQQYMSAVSKIKLKRFQDCINKLAADLHQLIENPSKTTEDEFARSCAYFNKKIWSRLELKLVTYIKYQLYVGAISRFSTRAAATSSATLLVRPVLTASAAYAASKIVDAPVSRPTPE